VKRLIVLLAVTVPIATAGIVVDLGDGSVRTLTIDPVSNGSFESPALAARSACATFFNFPFCSAVPGWSGNFYLVNGDSGGQITGVPAPPIPDGNQMIMVQTTGSANQSITITQPGTYTLSWFDAGRTFFSNTETYDVLFGGAVLASFSTTTSSLWTAHSLAVSTGAGTFTLTFQGTNQFGGDNSTFLDNVSLTGEVRDQPPGVPEPSTMVLAAGALAVLSLRLRVYSGGWKAQGRHQA
jgi:hypothetical protein